MNPSKIQPVTVQQILTVKKVEKRHFPNKIYTKPEETRKYNATMYYNSDNDEYDDMSEMMDLGFD